MSMVPTPSAASNGIPPAQSFQTGASDLGGAVGSLFQGFSDQASASADLAKAAMSRSAYEADLLKSQGDLAEGAAYGEAATLADLNAKFTAQSTAIQESQADRTLFQSLGETSAGVASSGFAEGGSAGDILRSSASQGALKGGAGPAGAHHRGWIYRAGLELHGHAKGGRSREPGGHHRGAGRAPSRSSIQLGRLRREHRSHRLIPRGRRQGDL